MILHGNDLRVQILDAMSQIENTVCQTLGVNGRTVIVKKFYQNNGEIIGTENVSTKDGFTITEYLARETQGLLQAIADMLHKSIGRQWTDVGDGTTTATKMCITFYKLMVKEIEDSPQINVHQLVNKYKGYAEKIIEGLTKQKRNVETPEELIRIATISANNDETIGKIVGDVVWKASKYGKVSVEKSLGHGITSEIVDGYVIGGCQQPYWLQVHGVHAFKAQKPKIILTTDLISAGKDVMNLMATYDSFKDPSITFVIICHSITLECAKHIAKNNEERVKNRLPPYRFVFIEHGKTEGTEKREFMEDLAAISSAKLLSKELNGRAFGALNRSDLGEVNLVDCNMQETALEFTKTDVMNTHIETIQKEFDDIKTLGQRKEWLNTRLCYFKGAIGKIFVGAITSGERSQNDDFIDDSVKTARSALKDGYLLGGGLALLNIQTDGTAAMRSICDAPFLQMCENSGIAPNNLLGVVDNRIGIDYFSGGLINYEEKGIFDSFRSQTTAVQVGCSFACNLITANTKIG